MNWKIPTPTSIWDGTVVLVGLLLVAFKKELLDWLKERFKKSHGWLSSWLENRHFARRVTDEELKDILGAGLEGLETSLYFLAEEYKADRVTIISYQPLPAGGASAELLVQVRFGEMPSVRNLLQLPVSDAIWHEIQLTESLPNRVRYVQDAQLSGVVALRAAMLSAGAFSAYYQVLSQPMERPLRLLAISWKTLHVLTPEQLNVLHFSGIFCSNVLSGLDKWKPTSSG